MPPPRRPTLRGQGTFTITSLDRLHQAGSKLYESEAERNRFIRDPVKYLTTAGFQVPNEFVTELRTSAFRINEVLTGSHNPVASIAVA